MRIFILVVFFSTFFNLSNFAQSKNIQITIPSFPCLEKEYPPTLERTLRNDLNQLNTKRAIFYPIKYTSEEEYEELLFKSDQFDLIQLTLLKLFPYALLKNLSTLKYYYPNEETFLKAYDFSVIEETSKTKRLEKKYPPDFNIKFEELRFSNENHLYYKIHFQHQKDNPIVFSDSLHVIFKRGDNYYDDIFENYKTMTWSIASKISELDSYYIESELLQKKRKTKLNEKEIVQGYIPPLLHTKLTQEVNYLNEFEFAQGVINKDSTIFYGVFNRIFNNSDEYRNFVLSTKRPQPGIYRKTYFSFDPVSYFVKGLNYEGDWYFSLDPCNGAYSFLEPIETLFEKGFTFCDLLDHISWNSTYYMEDSIDVNSNFLEEFYIFRKDKNGLPKIIKEYEQQKKQQFLNK